MRRERVEAIGVHDIHDVKCRQVLVNFQEDDIAIIHLTTIPRGEELVFGTFDVDFADINVRH